MVRKSGRYYLNIAVIVFVSATFLEAACAQTNDQTAIPATNLFSVSPLTLKGDAGVAPLGGLGQTTAELEAKVRRYFEARDYKRALDYAITGLESDPKRRPLLEVKAIALAKLGRFSDAVAARKDILPVGTEDVYDMDGLGELLLMANQIDEYRAFLSKYKTQIEGAYGGALLKYFSVLEAYQTGDPAQFRRVVTQSLTALPSKQGRLLGDWEFDELHTMISSHPDSHQKRMLLTFVRVLTGELSRDRALEAIKGL
jgi:tetratricopeptide (TPR) repeat protein